MVPGASLRAHVFPFSRQNPPPVELPAASFRPSPPSVIQEAALSPPGIKDIPAGAAERYWTVLTLPLDGMFTSWVGRLDTIEGDEEPDAGAYEGGGGGGGQWERHPGSEASAKEE